VNLASLETDGGKVLIIVFMLVFIVGIVALFTITGHPLQESGKALASGAVASLLTLLYQYLKPGKEQ
jgi:uncharacterized membrane protein